MSEHSSDALVFFGATGDLAYKKIFPSLHAMVKRGALDVPVIGVAKSGWGLDQLKARARESIEKHGELDASAFDKLMKLLRYVDGDYADSGEGRWTITAAIDEGVPVPVLSASLYQRFSSRGEADFENRVLSAMRYEFGGHRETVGAGQGKPR